MSTETSILRRALQPVAGPTWSQPQLALGLLLAMAAAKLALHLLTIVITPYEIHRDEFLYLAMGEHLRFWTMDFPPAIAVLAKASRWLFGDTLFAVRIPSALAGTAIVVLTGLLARDFGGGRLAQLTAMVTVFWVPLFIRPAALFQPVVWDQLWWTLGFYALLHIVRENHPRWWITLGIACGLGLLNKFSILFFGFGALAGLLLAGRAAAESGDVAAVGGRPWLAKALVRPSEILRNPWSWTALAISLLLGSPTLVGQTRLDFPVLVHMHDLQTHQLYRVTPSEFLFGQVWMLGPALLVALAGLGFLFSKAGRDFRALGIAALLPFGLLLALHGKPYYAGPIYPMLFAAGAVVLVRFARGRRALSLMAIAFLTLVGLLSLPFGLPVLPPELMSKFASPIKPARMTNRGTVLRLPQDYADMLGWEEQVRAVAQVYAALPSDQQARAGLIARNYGEAGALEFYGPRYGLPRRIMLPDNFLLWPADSTCDIVVTIGIPVEDLQRFFQRVRVEERFDHPWMVQEERDRIICVAQKPLRDLQEGWVRRTGWSRRE